MKKVISALSLLVVSFFFFVSSSSAATFSRTFSPDLYDIFDTTFFQNYINDNKNSTYLNIFGKDATGTFAANAAVPAVDYPYSCSAGSLSSGINCTQTRRASYTYYNTETWEVISSTTKAISTRIYGTDGRIIYFSTVPLISTNGDTFNLSDGTNSWSCTSSVDSPCVIPDLYTFYNMFYSTPEPPVDNYPLLTLFFTISLEKIGYISNYFTSNYLYLTIFVIFIIYSIFLLLKRRFSS